jgi:methionyl aminopeptidase
MEEERMKKERDVGSMSFMALKKAAAMVKPGAKLLDIANSAEKFVRDQGYELAFPINLSANERAAHYSPSFDDQTVVGENDIIKVDFGAAKDGILGDCAITVDVSSENQRLVESTEKALQDAIATVRSGVEVTKIGAAIEKTISSYGFKPVKNLGGHGVEEHDLHADLFIPNYANGDDTVLEEDMTVAIEPFATDGKGMVTEEDTCEIYSFVGEGQVRSQQARSMLSKIAEHYPSEPFAIRWLADPGISRFALYTAVQELLRSGSLEPHPTLTELGKGMVSQAEAKLLVTKDGCEILTK